MSTDIKWDNIKKQKAIDDLKVQIAMLNKQVRDLTIDVKTKDGVISSLENILKERKK